MARVLIVLIPMYFSRGANEKTDVKSKCQEFRTSTFDLTKTLEKETRTSLLLT